MAHLIQEAKRFQQLAGVINEEENKLPSNSKGATSTVNTPDETMLDKAIEINPSLIKRLQNISNPIELDGLFKIILSDTSLKEVPKSQIVNALVKALKEIEPTKTSITTVKPKM